MSKRIFSLILVLNLAVMSLFTCGAGVPGDSFFAEKVGIMTDLKHAPENRGLFTIGLQAPSQEKDITEVFEEYTLTDADIIKFEKQLVVCERMLMRNAPAALFEAAVNHLDEQVSHIQTQSLIAEVLYYYDMSDETLENNYLHSTEVSSEVSNTYISFLQEVYNSGVTEYEAFFEDWTEVQLKYLSTGSDEAVALELRNAEIMTLTNSLSGDDFEAQIGDLYAEFVENGNKIAGLGGYDNYYEYSSELVYTRDYGKEEREKFREYVTEYIVPIYNDSFLLYEEAYNALDREGKSLYRDLMYDSFEKLDENYLDGYFASLTPEVEEGMQHMFVNDNYITTNSRNAYDGAFTVSAYDEPFCYFGPNYQNLFTVVHEIGHYYGEQCADTDWAAYDILETHSQGNEMMFLCYLESELPEDVYAALKYYQLYYMAELIVQASIVDAFEERVYNLSDVSGFTTADFDEIMHEVIADFGIDESDSYMYMSGEWFWRNVCISSAVYYVSYATSAMASLNLYSQCVNDYDTAVEAYRMIQEEVDEESTFTGTLENAGVPSVFEEEAYKILTEIFE